MLPPRRVRPIITVDDERRARRCAQGLVVLIDDDPEILAAFAAMLDIEGYACECYQSAQAYLAQLDVDQPRFPGPVCVLCDIRMPEIDGLALQRRLAELDGAPMLLMSGVSGAHEAASAFRAGAVDFLIKPIDAEVLLKAVAQALKISAQQQRSEASDICLKVSVESLTARERDVALQVCAGLTNPEIAERLGIALRTVKLYRQHVMEKLGAESVADLVRLVDRWRAWS